MLLHRPNPHDHPTIIHGRTMLLADRSSPCRGLEGGGKVSKTPTMTLAMRYKSHRKIACPAKKVSFRFQPISWPGEKGRVEVREGGRGLEAGKVEDYRPKFVRKRGPRGLAGTWAVCRDTEGEKRKKEKNLVLDVAGPVR